MQGLCSSRKMRSPDGLGRRCAGNQAAQDHQRPLEAPTVQRSRVTCLVRRKRP